MKKTVQISFIFLFTYLSAAEVLFSPQNYAEVRPSNDTFYSTYYDNKIKKAFRTLQNDKDTILVDQTNTSSTASSTHIASPLIHDDSSVKNVYIKNDMKNAKVYIKHDDD